MDHYKNIRERVLTHKAEAGYLATGSGLDATQTAVDLAVIVEKLADEVALMARLLSEKEDTARARILS